MAPGHAAIILAAGASQRMGTPKALLEWHGSTLLDYAIEQARAAGALHIVAVLGPATRALKLNATIVVNPDPETGRSASIRLGAIALDDSVDAMVIQSVDQPVPASVLETLFAAEGDVVVPTYLGRRGHPVRCAGSLLRELREVTEADQGLRAVVRRHTVTEVPVDSESVIWNLNDPGAYAAAMAKQ
jgi:CTP:molybdopterin cytidylyltransferase MocA